MRINPLLAYCNYILTVSNDNYSKNVQAKPMIQPLKCDTVNFGYKWRVKDLYRDGKLPTVIKGVYGEFLDKKGVSVEHIVAHSKSGASKEHNYALAHVFDNNLRGSDPLKMHTTKDNIVEYLQQFVGIRVKDSSGNMFIGNKYINEVLPSFKKEGFNILHKDIFGK